ncbi:MAG: ParA family protein [Gammaproteobacteria bacterium]|nr:ParA family protein [Gammaproteobacteria bacterium]
MQTVSLLNSKGGCGKSTIATNLASYLANGGARVGLMDLDPQGSSTTWLKARPGMLPRIQQVDEENLQQLHQELDYLVVDFPSGIRGPKLARVLDQSNFCIIPVLPSPHDIRAVGAFLRDVLRSPAVGNGRCQLSVIANRVKLHTLVYQSLENFLSRLDIPFISTFRETQNYVRTAAHGLGVADMPRTQLSTDLDEWRKLVGWVKQESYSLEREAV